MYNSKLVRVYLSSFIIIILGLLIFSCSDKGNEPIPGTPSGVMKNHSDCGGYDETISSMVSLAYDDTLSCIDYVYTDETLTLVHHNSAFNCCPMITSNVTISGDTIVLNEIESYDQHGACHCLCLFDLTFEVVNLPQSVYIIVVNEIYLEQDDEQIVFSIDLATDFSDSYCTIREHYPWGVYDHPQGQISSSSECGGYENRVLTYHSESPSDTTSCIVYDFTSENTLQLLHTNAVLNCCPIILADISIANNEIIIEEIDSLDQGGCDCICTYDIDYIITNLTPGSYTIKIIEPYLGSVEDTLTGTINLINDPTGVFCAIRDNLPIQ